MKTTLLLLCSLFALTLTAAEPAKAEKLTVDDVVKLWSPQLESATDYTQAGASPKQTPTVGAYSFRVVGPTFEELWNHYAKLCGMKKEYAAETFVNAADTSPKGSYVVADRTSGDDKGGRGLSVFLLKTEGYTVTVTFQPGPDGKSILGSLTVVMP